MNGTTCFFDLETGGLLDRHPVIQVAAIAVDENWAEKEVIEVKIKFKETGCDPEALKMNSYEPGLWAEHALDRSVARAKLHDFFENHKTWSLLNKHGKRYNVARIAGHNAASFDAPRLRALWDGRFTPFAWFYPLDTIQLAFWYFAEWKSNQPDNYRLETLCQHFRIDAEGAHDALADVRMTIKLAKVLIDGIDTKDQ